MSKLTNNKTAPDEIRTSLDDLPPIKNPLLYVYGAIIKLFFYAFALFNLISLIYSMGYDYMNGAEIHYDFYGAFFVCWLIFFGILKAILGI